MQATIWWPKLFTLEKRRWCVVLIVRRAAAWLRTARCLQRGDQLITIIGRRRGNQRPDTAADKTVVGVSPTLSLILTQASVTIFKSKIFNYCNNSSPGKYLRGVE